MELHKISDEPRRFVTRLPDLDAPIRRIFNFKRLIETIRERKLTLVPPHKWEDPREDLAALCMLDGFYLPPPPRKRQLSLAVFLPPTWAQCWSLNPGSDTLLRAYSTVRNDGTSRRNSHPHLEGATVTTTVRRLLTASKTWISEGQDSHVVLGKVEYLGDDEIQQRLANACNSAHGPEFFRTVQGRADSLLWKRRYFEHEQEVRLLVLSRTWDRDEPIAPTRQLPIDPDALFESISVDPRLLTFEEKERATELRAAGYNGNISIDQSYQKIALKLMMTRDWPDP